MTNSERLQAIANQMRNNFKPHKATCKECQGIVSIKSLEDEYRFADYSETCLKCYRIKRMKSFCIPERYWDYTAEKYTFSPKVKTLYDEIVAGADGVIYGNVGTGKTHLAVMILFASQTNGRFLKERDIQIYVQNRDTQALWRLKYREKLLVIDDIGQIGDKFTQTELFAILDARWESKLHTVITGNFDGKGIAEFLTQRLTDRYKESGCYLELSGNSKRKKTRR